MEEYGIKIWIEGKLKNVKELAKEMEDKLGKLNIQGIAEKAGGLAGIAKPAAVIGILYAIKKVGDKIFDKLKESSPYLQGIMKMFKVATMMFFRPFGDALASFIKPMAIWMIKLASKWLKFTSTPEGGLVAKAGAGAMVGAGKGALIGGIMGSVVPGAGTLAGAGAGAIIGGMVGSAIMLLKDALNGVKNVYTIAKAWMDYLMNKLFGINMDEVRAKIVEFLYVKLPNIFWDAIQGIKNAFNNLLNYLSKLGSTVWTGIVNVFKNAWDYISNFGSWLWGKLKTVWNYIQDFGIWIWDKIKSVWNYAEDFGSYLWTKLKEIADKIPVIGWFVKTPEKGGQTGIDVVPETGMYKLHRGERVVPSSRSTGGAAIYNTFNFSGNVSHELDIESVIRRGARAIEMDLRSRGLA